MILLNYEGCERNPKYLWGETYQYLGKIKNGKYVFDDLVDACWDTYSTFDQKLGVMLYFAAICEHLMLGGCIVSIDDLKRNRVVKDILSAAKEVCKERNLPFKDFDFEGITVKKFRDRNDRVPSGIAKIIKENNIMIVDRMSVGWNTAEDFLSKFRYYDILSTDKVGIVITGENLYD